MMSWPIAFLLSVISICFFVFLFFTIVYFSELKREFKLLKEMKEEKPNQEPMIYMMNLPVDLLPPSKSKKSELDELLDLPEQKEKKNIN